MLGINQDGQQAYVFEIWAQLRWAKGVDSWQITIMKGMEKRNVKFVIDAFVTNIFNECTLLSTSSA